MATPSSTFSPDCIKAPKPIVYLVESFLQTPAQGGERLSFRSYPAEVQAAFQQNWDASLSTIPLRGPQDPTSQKAPTLFQTKWVKTADEVPAFLGRGDIIIGFAHLPAYSVASDGSLDLPPSSDCLRTCVALLDRNIAALQTKWKSAFGAALTNGPSTPGPGQNGDAGGHSIILAFNRDVSANGGGPKRKVLWSYKIGVVDIGPAANDALYVIPGSLQRSSKTASQGTSNRRLILQNILMRLGPDGKTPLGDDFGTQAVNQAADAAKEMRGEFLQAIGRALAYVAVHEFWHCAAESDHKPELLGAGDQVIESQPETRHKGLKLQPKAVEQIIGVYRSTWCKSILDKRVSLGAI